MADGGFSADFGLAAETFVEDFRAGAGAGSGSVGSGGVFFDVVLAATAGVSLSAAFARFLLAVEAAELVLEAIAKSP